MHDARCLLALFLGAVTMCAGFGCDSERSEISDLSEASTNFDLENVRPFLLRVSKRVEGFGTAEIDTVVREITEMPVDGEREWHFEVEHEGTHVSLHIRVFMDDLETPDVYFFTSPELAASIQSEMESFADELGI